MSTLTCCIPISGRQPSNDMSQRNSVHAAGPAEYTYNPLSPTETLPDVTPRRGVCGRVGIFVKQKGEQLLHRTGQLSLGPQQLIIPAPYAGLDSYTRPQPYYEPQSHAGLRHAVESYLLPPQPRQEAPDSLLEEVFNKLELTAAEQPHPLPSHPPVLTPRKPASGQLLSSQGPSRYPETPNDIIARLPTPAYTYQALAELSAEPDLDYALEFTEAEARYRAIGTPSSAVKRPSYARPGAVKGNPPYRDVPEVSSYLPRAYKEPFNKVPLSQSTADLHFDHDLNVNESIAGFTRRGSPAGLKVCRSKRRDSFVEPRDNTVISPPLPVQTYTPRNSDRSQYRAYTQYKAYSPPKDVAESEEVSKKAQKLKIRISSGFMLDRTLFTEVINAATEEKLMIADCAETIQETESPISALSPSAMALGPEIRVTTPAEMGETSKVIYLPYTVPTTFDEILKTPTNQVDEFDGRSSDSLSKSDDDSTVVEIVEPTSVKYQTMQRVDKVEVRSLARSIQPGESAPSTWLLDAPVPTTGLPIRSSSLVAPTESKTDHEEDDSSWNWARFVDKDFEDPAVAHSRRYREKKAWAKNNTGPLVAFERESWAADAEVVDEKKVEVQQKKDNRFSWRLTKSVDELLNVFEGR